MVNHARSLSAIITDNVQASTDAVTEATCDAVARSSDAFQYVLHHSQLPEWMKVDPYIKLGYRRQSNSFRDCFQSLFYLHNELVNIWSHLLPAIVYSVFLYKLDFQTIYKDVEVPTADRAIFQLFILCTVGCLLLSAIYHAANSHSEHISRCCLKLDYFGIVLSVVGTNISAAYFGLYGHHILQGAYMLFFVICAALVLYLLLRGNVDGPGAVFRRAGIIVALASTWFLPVVHMSLKKGVLEAAQGFAITHTAIMVLLDLLALFFYSTHIPEKWWPHTFDLWGASHQIFHILIDIGQVVALLGLQRVMLRQCLHAQGLPVFPASSETSLSLMIQPITAFPSGYQPLFDMALSMCMEPSIALWNRTQV